MDKYAGKAVMDKYAVNGHLVNPGLLVCFFAPAKREGLSIFQNNDELFQCHN